MTRAIAAAIVALLAAIAAAADPSIPREGKLSADIEASGSITFLQLGTERLQMIWDSTGLRRSDIGDILHDAKVHCVGGALAVNGLFDDEVTSCTYTRPDGDQAFAVLKGGGKIGGEARGMVTLVGGTGKLAGLAGTLEYTRRGVAVSAGSVSSVTRTTGTYRLASSPAAASVRPVEASFRVFRPDGPGPHPAVVFLSGCSGFSPAFAPKAYERPAERLRDLGFVVVWVDYLGRRNLANCATRGVTQEEAGRDAVAAASWLRSQPYVDPKRITALGWSFGGGSVLAALGSHGADQLVFTRAIAYYPYCDGVRPWSNRIPVLVLRGGADDVAPQRLCEPALVGSRADLKIVDYPGAQHAFDIPDLPPKMTYPFGTVGHHPQAAAAAWDEVQRFLRSTP